MKQKELNILCVDDENNNLITFAANFRKNYNIFTADSIEQANTILEKISIKVIVADQRMPHLTGLEFFESICKKYPDPIRIIFTGFSDFGILSDAISKGLVYRYLMKPMNDFELKIAIDNAFELYHLRKEVTELRQFALKNNYIFNPLNE